jgi:hypothetical protein
VNSCIPHGISSTCVTGRPAARDAHVTWIPGSQARAFGYALMHWAREDVDELRVERVQNLTPLGYLHVRATDSSEAVFRVFQPKRLRSLTAAFMPLVPPEPGPRTSAQVPIGIGREHAAM